MSREKKSERLIIGNFISFLCNLVSWLYNEIDVFIKAAIFMKIKTFVNPFQGSNMWCLVFNAWYLSHFPHHCGQNIPHPWFNEEEVYFGSSLSPELACFIARRHGGRKGRKDVRIMSGRQQRKKGTAGRELRPQCPDSSGQTPLSASSAYEHRRLLVNKPDWNHST